LQGPSMFKLIFVIFIVSGTKQVFSAFFPFLIASIIALAILAIWLLMPIVIVHNIALLFAIAGISAAFGLSVSIQTMIFILGALSLYDVLAVYKTKHMVKMFKGMMNRGVLLAMIVPLKLRGFFEKTSNIKPQSGFMLLGTGDVAFPLIFAVTVMKESITASIFVVGGALVGVASVYALLLYQTQRRALPALPPIASGAILGFILSTLI